MVPEPYDVDIVDQISVRYAVYFEIFIVKDIYFCHQGDAELLPDQSLDRVLVGTLAQYVRLDAQTAVETVGIAAQT